MKDLLTYCVIIIITMLLVAYSCNDEPTPQPKSDVDTINVPCTTGSTVQILCDSILISLSCNEGSEVSCGDKIFVAVPVDTIDSPIDTIVSPRDRSAYPVYNGNRLPAGRLRSMTGAPVDTIDYPVSCESGSIVYIVCGEEVFPLPCNEKSIVTCGIYNYVASPVDTID